MNARWPWAAPVLLAALTALAYANAAPPALVYDDNAMLAQSTEREGVSEIGQLFRKGARGPAGNRRLYRPLAMASLAVDRSLHGTDPRGYHLTSIALHVAATLALFGLLLALRAPRSGAFLAALVFGVHPIHTEAVDVAYNRSEILATLAVVSALAWLWCWQEGRPVMAWGGAALFYFLGLLCRESAVTLPLLIAASLLVLRPPASLQEGVKRLAPVAVLAVPLLIYLWMRQSALGEPAGGIARSVVDAGLMTRATHTTRLATVATTVRDYWRMLVWPWPLRASYEDYVVRGVGWAVALHAVLIAVAFAVRRRAPALTLGVLFFYIALVPSTRLFSDPATLAERFVYLPSAGLAIPVAFAAGWAARRFGERPTVALGVGLATALACLTLARNQAWHGKEALWEAEARAGGQDWKALLNLCEVRLGQRRFEEALRLCESGAGLAPGRQGFATNRGIALVSLGRLTEAEAAFSQAVEQSGGASADRANLARLYAATRRLPQAEEAYRQAAEAESQPAVRHALQGEMLLRCRADLPGARAEFEAALALAPALRNARQGLQLVEQAERAARRP